MALFIDFTAQEQELINAQVSLARAWAGGLGRTMANAVILDDNWDAQISALVTTLDVGATIPNNSGLSGAAAITREQLITLMNSQIPALLAGYNTNAARQLYAELAGPGNIIV